MTLRDSKSNLQFEVGIPAHAATNGVKAGSSHDMNGCDSITFEHFLGAGTSTTATYTLEIQEGDTSTPTGAVADADLIGTEAAASHAAQVAHSGKVLKIGYKGIKRYVRAYLTSDVTGGIVGVHAVKHLLHRSPVT